MSSFRLSARYAKSLLDLAIEQNQLNEVFNDVRYFNEVLKSVRELSLLLRNPIIHADKKLKIVEQLFGTRFNKITNEFFKLVISKHREEFLPEFATEFIAQYNRKKNITVVTVTAAIPVDEELLNKVRTLLKTDSSLTNIEFQTKVDEKLVGGFVLQYGDKLYDASISRALEVLDNNFLDNSYIKKY